MSNIVDDARQSGTQEQKGSDLLTLDNINRHFKDTIKEIKAQYSIYKKLPKSSLEESRLADNILRSQVFFLDSALDLYVHDIVKYGFKNMLSSKWEKESENKDVLVVTVKFTILKKCMDSDGNDEIKDLLLSELGYSIRTCMKYDAILKHLNMVGINLPSNYTDTNEQDYKDMKKDIDNLSNRRNKIGHNSDLDANKEKIKIEHSTVFYWIQKVEFLQQLIHTVTESTFQSKQ